MLFNYKNKIKELERCIENLHGHLEERGRVNRERQDIISNLRTELIELKELLADDIISKINYYNNKGFQLIESWRIPDLTLEQAYEQQDKLNDQGWFTLINNPNEHDLNIYEIIVYSKEI